MKSIIHKQVQQNREYICQYIIIKIGQFPLTKYKRNEQKMGCTNVKKQHKQQLPTPSTAAGVLTVTITNGVFFHQASMFKMDPYLKLKLSNQQQQSKVIQKGGKKPVFNQQFKFFINSCCKVYGRNLEIQVMDKKVIGADNFIGYGIVDLDPVINVKKDGDSFRCMLNYQYKQAGFVNISAKFEEQPVEVISFRFEQAVIRRKTSTFGDMNCWIHITVGEQVLKTKKHYDTKARPPCWHNQIKTFKTLVNSVKECVIKVMDDDKQIGMLTMQMQKLLAKDTEQSFIEDFQYQDGIYAGTIKFQTLKGPNPKFSTIEPHRNPLSIQLKQIIREQNKNKENMNMNMNKQNDNYFSNAKQQTVNPDTHETVGK